MCPDKRERSIEQVHKMSEYFIKEEISKMTEDGVKRIVLPPISFLLSAKKLRNKRKVAKK